MAGRGAVGKRPAGFPSSVRIEPFDRLAGAQDRLRPLIEVEMPRRRALAMGVSTSLDTNGNGIMQARWPKSSFSPRRSEEHTSELQSLMRISYAVFCLKKKNKKKRS